jgi:hypothetical protein
MNHSLYAHFNNKRKMKKKKEKKGRLRERESAISQKYKNAGK